MLIVMAGASGFLGGALGRKLRSGGHEVVQLVRHAPNNPDQVRWDPYAGAVDRTLIASADTVVNLAGAPIAHWPWTASYKKTLLDSRVKTTSTLATAIASVDNPPALVNASGIDYYASDVSTDQVDEDSPAGDFFLAGVCQQWEQATEPASAAGARVALIRTGVVLDKSGGILKIMLIPFKLAAGARLGSGQQWFPSISLADYVEAASRIVTDSAMQGPYNFVAPVPATNADLTRALGERLHRPAVLVVPAFAIKLAAGDLSQQVLGSLKATPRRLIEAGFEFKHPTLDMQVDAALA